MADRKVGFRRTAALPGDVVQHILGGAIYLAARNRIMRQVQGLAAVGESRLHAIVKLSRGFVESVLKVKIKISRGFIEFILKVQIGGLDVVIKLTRGFVEFIL